jgi:predicted naringenin-chalcone synthase
MAAYLNRIATAVPPNDVHAAFVAFARTLFPDNRRRAIFERMAERGQISHRWSCLAPAGDGGGPSVDADGFYRRGDFPSTGERMRRYEQAAADLAHQAVKGLNLGPAGGGATHLIVTTCTGFSAPGIDLSLVQRCGLDPAIERTVIGFMGCYAAVNALKLARHIVRSEPEARVLVVSLELCTLHLQETDDLEQVLTFLLFGDGAAAALVTAEPEGLELDSFHAVLIPEAADQIAWYIRDGGFDMVLSGRAPATLARALRSGGGDILRGGAAADIDLWAVHPGGRTVLDAVEGALALSPGALACSRAILNDYGNMSSATVLFVLERLMREARSGQSGCGMAFGPGLTAETLLFHAV